MKNEGEGKKAPAGFSPLKIERNALTLSLVIVILGLMCLGGIEPYGDTWYVLMFVFALNAGLIAWIIIKLVRRRAAARREDETKR